MNQQMNQQLVVVKKIKNLIKNPKKLNRKQKNIIKNLKKILQILIKNIKNQKKIINQKKQYKKYKHYYIIINIFIKNIFFILMK